MADRRAYLQFNGQRYVQINGIRESTGSADGNALVATRPNGRLDQSLMPQGVGIDAEFFEATEAISAGKAVNIHDDEGAKVRKADASNQRECHGFVLESVSQGEQVRVYFDSFNDQLSGLVPGTTYYLAADDPGGITDAAPVAEGNIVQEVGFATGVDEIRFKPSTVTLIEEA